MDSIFVYILGWIFVCVGITFIGIHCQEEGRNEYRYVGPKSTYVTRIAGERREFEYGKIDEILEKELKNSAKSK